MRKSGRECTQEPCCVVILLIGSQFVKTSYLTIVHFSGPAHSMDGHNSSAWTSLILHSDCYQNRKVSSTLILLLDYRKSYPLLCFLSLSRALWYSPLAYGMHYHSCWAAENSFHRMTSLLSSLPIFWSWLIFSSSLLSWGCYFWSVEIWNVDFFCRASVSYFKSCSYANKSLHGSRRELLERKNTSLLI